MIHTRGKRQHCFVSPDLGCCRNDQRHSRPFSRFGWTVKGAHLGRVKGVSFPTYCHMRFALGERMVVKKQKREALVT